MLTLEVFDTWIPDDGPSTTIGREVVIDFEDSLEVCVVTDVPVIPVKDESVVTSPCKSACDFELVCILLAGRKRRETVKY